MAIAVSDSVLDQLFLNARTFSHWQAREIEDEVLRQLYDLARQCPTAMNCSPARLLFVKSADAKERLRPCLAPGNVDKTMAAPVCMIVAYDTHFYEQLPTLFPIRDVKPMFADNTELALSTAQRNSALQGAYLILAARALGLDCGPMSGFNADKLNDTFFKDGRYQANFLVNLGYGDAGMLHERSPRLTFDQACTII